MEKHIDAKMQRILLVEDDQRLALLVQDYLAQNGFSVAVQSRGDLVEEQLKQAPVDLLILDIMLPGKDGLAICKSVRTFFSAPILILTSKDSDIDQVLGLEFGADDYVIKPVDPRVLLARIQAVLRRVAPRTDNEQSSLKFGQLRLHSTTRVVMLGDTTVELSTHEFDLLWLLATRAGVIQGRDELFHALYGRPYDGLDRTIDVRISHLRKKLGDDLDTPRRVKTIWGRGYLFVPDAWE